MRTAICLEEMYNVRIEKGFLYYGETRHRKEIPFTGELRKLVEEKCTQMHRLYDRKSFHRQYTKRIASHVHYVTCVCLRY